ncbi:MAG TPA: hypothetical protein DHW39_01720 [Erysipelotrichaceae bacterium]|nr:hypothetical protein [Erysipelotrichaceae bacterium]
MIRFPSIPGGTTMLYLLAASGPALVLLLYIYRKDGAEKEPGGLLMKLFIGGVLAAAAAALLETGAEYVQYLILGNRHSYNWYAIMDAVMVGFIEEGTKFWFLKKFSWKERAFNYRFDGIVYAVFVSLGFAAIENVLYVFNYGTIDVMVNRAILTVPAHMSFAVYMGLFYSYAKLFDRRGDRSGRRLNLYAAYLSAALLHAFFDGTLLVDMEYSIVVFYVFVILLDIMVFRMVRSASRNDRPI